MVDVFQLGDLPVHSHQPTYPGGLQHSFYCGQLQLKVIGAERSKFPDHLTQFGDIVCEELSLGSAHPAKLKSVSAYGT